MKPLDLTRFDFYALRFRQSEAVQQMTAEEVGQYLLLMIEAWLAGKEASLPKNPKLLAIYARCAPGQQVSDLVLSCWTERGGRLYNERLSEEWAEAKERASFAHERAKKGAAARYGKDASSIPQASSDNAPIQPIPEPNTIQIQSHTTPSTNPAADKIDRIDKNAETSPDNEKTETVDFVSHRKFAAEAAKYFFERLGDETVKQGVLRSTVDAFQPFVTSDNWDTLRLYIDFVFEPHPEDTDPTYWLPLDVDRFIHHHLQSDMMKKRARHWHRKLNAKSSPKKNGKVSSSVPSELDRYYAEHPEEKRPR